MTHASDMPATELRDLSEDELEQIGGGMRTDPDYTSSNVIDARGGSLTVWGVTLTYDVNGKVSSIS
ncbi:hypothetical protein [Labrys wisconsinensis]|uniref:Uncharacterized protein n=1 Tax=Labrys wisconsinensis TaxID=425677 RepID=A0ABU0JF29_9HYPH|nr:hypothetical protein [Labrys wisconsinensis]MDQ0472885.1 hypothetical protein [Labrys wisconsinensis]